MFPAVAGNGVPAAVDTGITALQKAPASGRLPANGVRALSGTGISPTVRFSGRAFQLDPRYLPAITGAAGHVLLQLKGSVTEAQRAQLTARGVVLGDYVPDNAWKARVPAAGLAEIRALPFVHAIGDLLPADKVPSHVLKGDFDPRSLEADGTLNLQVSFHPDVTYAEAARALARLGVRPAQARFLSGQRLTVRVRQDQVLALASLDEVLWLEDREAPKSGTNAQAAAQVRANGLWAAPLGLNGAGIAIGMWDEGLADVSHNDLSGRVSAAEQGSVAAHSTHVAGTLAGSGAGSPAARGMAAGARIYSYEYTGDPIDEQQAAQQEYGIALSNHSWGYITGWQRNYFGDNRWSWFGGAGTDRDPNFATYTATSRNWDRLVDDTGLIVIKSIGNDRNDTGAGCAAHYHGTDKRNTYTDCHGPDGSYGTVGPIATAKNVIAVGAVDRAGGMTAFSAWGPTEDGRIKPDVVAPGLGIYSTYTKNGYRSMDGTSMSTPVVSGSVALLVQRYRAVNHGATPAPHVIRALLANTARDLGQVGPDYQFGFGMLDTQAAAEAIEADAGVGRRLQMESVASGVTVSRDLTVPAGTAALRFTLAWIDPAGSPEAAQALVNDLDLALIAPDGRTYYPYSLGGADAPTAAASTAAPNRVDNIEQIVVPMPVAGTWKLQVRGTRVQGTQSYVVASNVAMSADPTPPTLLDFGLNRGARYATARSVEVRLRGSDNLGVTGYYLSESSSPPAAAQFTPVSLARDFDATVSYTLSSGDGAKTVYVWLRDAVGNRSTQMVRTVTLDTQPPAPPTVEGSLAANGRVSWRWSGSEAGLFFRYKLNQADMAVGTLDSTAQEYVTTAPLSAGGHTLYVQARDAAGHWSQVASYTVTVPAGATAPVAADAGLPPAPLMRVRNPTNSPRPTWEWMSSSTGGIFRLRLDDPDVESAPETNVFWFRPGSDLSDGVHVLYLQERAPNGLWSNAAAYSVLVDTAPPATAVQATGASSGVGRTVTLSCKDSSSGCAATYYTLDGSDPTTSSAFYEGPILVPPGATLRYLSLDQAGNAESVQSETYAASTDSGPAAGGGGGGGAMGWWPLLALLWLRRRVSRP